MSLTASRATQVVMHTLRARLLTVRSTQLIGPRMIRIVVGGDDLETDFPAPAFAAADHVKIVLPDPETGIVPMPGVENDRLVDLQAIPTPVRDYTVRSVDVDGLVLDFVLHDHGPAGRWASNASIGDPLGVLGPRGSEVFPSGYKRYVLIADETALPAIGRWLDEPGWAAPVSLHLLARSADEYPLPARLNTDVHWHIDSPGSTRADTMVEAARAAVIDADTFVWAAGESVSLKPLRRFLKSLGLSRDAAEIDGYWRQGTSNLDHHIVDDDD